jgi:hypothetical protein
MDASRLRSKMRRAYAQMAACIEALAGRSALFAASLYVHKTQCGNPRCRCATGAYRHTQWCVSFLEEGRSRTRVVPRGIRSQVERLTSDYRRVRRARRELGELFGQLLEAADALAEVRCAAGRERFARRVAEARRGGRARPGREGG